MDEWMAVVLISSLERTCIVVVEPQRIDSNQSYQGMLKDKSGEIANRKFQRKY